MRQLRWITVLGLALVATGLGGVALIGGPAGVARAALPGTAAVSSSAGGPVPAGFSPRSFTAIDDYRWWLLGATSCSSPPCQAIVRTTDGGVHFVAIPMPRVPGIAFSGLPKRPLVPGVSAIGFADSRDGYLFGPRFYDTHNGGASWQKVNLGGYVRALAIGGGYVYAVLVPSLTDYSGRLLRSPVRRDDWVVLRSAGTVSEGVSVHGADVFVEDRYFKHLLVSHDRGSTFTSYRPAGPLGLPCGDYAEPQPPVVWAHCPTGTASEVFRSTDSGRGFQPVMSGVMLSNHAVFAAASANVAVAGDFDLYRTVNGGRSFTRVGPTEHTWTYLGFTNATHGAGLVTTSSGRGILFYTTDAGRTYHPVPIVGGPFPGAPASQTFTNGNRCSAAPANRYLTSPAGCLSVRLADVDGDDRPDLVLLYTHPGVNYGVSRFTLKVYRASGGVLTAQLPAGDIPATFLVLRNVNARPGVEIFVHTMHLSNGETLFVYTFAAGRLQRAGGFTYGGDAFVQFGVTCHPPMSMVQDEFSLSRLTLPAAQRKWTHLTTTYTWVGASFKAGTTKVLTFTGAFPPASEIGLHC
jgi:hypothetical protein